MVRPDRRVSQAIPAPPKVASGGWPVRSTKRKARKVFYPVVRLYPLTFEGVLRMGVGTGL